MDLGKNYTSNDPDHVDSPEDWLASSLAFVGALGHLLQEGEGVVVEVRGDLKQFLPDTKNIIVCNVNEQITIQKAEDDNLSPGQLIWLIDRDN